MTNNNEFLSLIKATLGRRSNVSARALAKLINTSFGLQISERDLNPILYRYRAIFQREGASPPLWSLRAQKSTQALRGSRSEGPELQLNVETEVRPEVRSLPATNSPMLPDSAAQVQLYRELRKWQSEAIDAWKEKDGRGIVQAVTGTGKTFVATWIISKYINARRRCLVVVPTITLLGQWRETLQHDLGLEVTSLLGGTHGNSLDLSCAVTVGVVNSVAARAQLLDNTFGLLVADECHRYAGETFRHALLPSSPHRLGLTATLERSDEGVTEVLKPYFDGICFEYNYADARRDSVIAPYNVLSLSVDLEPDELQEYEEFGEAAKNASRQLIANFGYPEDSFGAFMERATQASATWNREGQLAGTYLSSIQKRRKILSGTQSKLEAVPLLADAIKEANKTIVFCETIDSAEHIRTEFSNHGVATAVYHSQLSNVAREEILEKYQDDSGYDQIDCLVAVRSLDEGIDIPRIDCGIIMASTRQRRQMIQRMGRVVRLKPEGTGAVVIVLYANDTAEDPNTNANPEESHFYLLRETAEVYRDRSLAAIDAHEVRAFIKGAICTGDGNAALDEREEADEYDEAEEYELEERDEEEYERYANELVALYWELIDHSQRVPIFTVENFLVTESGWGRQLDDIRLLEKMELIRLRPGPEGDDDASQDEIGSMNVVSIENCFSPGSHIMEYLHLLDW